VYKRFFGRKEIVTLSSFSIARMQNGRFPVAPIQKRRPFAAIVPNCPKETHNFLCHFSSSKKQPLCGGISLLWSIEDP
jgi:hypothetical protein